MTSQQQAPVRRSTQQVGTSSSVEVANHDVLDAVREFVGELRGEVARARVDFDSRLEQDLGISSLERAELIARLERRFRHPIGDEALATAETVASLATVVSCGTARGSGRELRLRDVPVDICPLPSGIGTLTAALEWHARRHPDRVHLVIRHDERDEMLTFGDLFAEALEMAAGLRAHGVGPRETVAIMLPTSRGFFQVFCGVLLLGAVPVPMYPPFRADRILDYVERQAGILENANARMLVTFAEVERVGSILRDRLTSPPAVVTAAALQGERPGSTGLGSMASSSGALIQYTSGSTGDPKGVYLTHDNLLANIRAIGARLELRNGDRVVSWLPLYHDMGLIGSWLGSLCFALPLMVMSPLAFLSRPGRWLRALSDFRGTVSPAPNFAYELCAKRVQVDELEGVDLSSVRLLLNGSEAVLPDTIRRFHERFASQGLSSASMYPVYGLAECAVGLAAPPPGRDPRVDWISQESFERDGAALPEAGGRRHAFVSCGSALPGHEIRVVDEAGRRAPERVQGLVEFRGPSVTAGYFRRPEATAAIRSPDGWTRSGDLGYLADGEIFITGRWKDVIIKAGRNLHPHELEAAASEVPGVRSGCVAAFGVVDDGRGTERLVVVAETREDEEVVRARLQLAIVARLSEKLGVVPDTVRLLRPGAVLKTSSGKIRRAATREAFLAGRLSARNSTPTRQWGRLAYQAALGRFRRLGRQTVAVLHTAYLLAVLGATVPLLWLVVTWASPAGARRAVRWFSRAVVSLSWCRVEVVGDAHRAQGPSLYAANHASYLDPIWLMAALPFDVRFAAKARLASYPVLGAVLRRSGFVLVERSDHGERVASARALSEALDAPIPLVVFPEGTFVRSPGLLPFRLGAFRAATLRSVPVVPVGLRGARDVLPDGALLIRPGTVRVALCPPQTAADDTWPSALALRDRVLAEVARASGELPCCDDPETELYSTF